MKHRHSTPCAECPWRKKSLAGWLGGHSAEFYSDALQANEVPACHLQDKGPNHPETSMCAGALSVAANSCLDPYRTPGGPEAKKAVGKCEDTFSHFSKFYEHHAGKPWVHPLMRESSS